MAEIKLVRLDFRLIHGQVIVRWIRQSGANRFVIVDDTLAQDDFMKEIYKMSAPSDYTLDLWSVDEAVAKWNENRWGQGGVFLLMKDVKTLYRLWKKGMEFPSVQVGGLGAGPGRINVYGPITLNSEDAKMLKEMQDSGTEVIFHQVPEEPSTTLDKILGKYDFGI